MNSLTLQIASLPDRENVVAEIWLGNNQVAEVSNEVEAELLIEIFPAPDGGTWAFDFDNFQLILKEAKDNFKTK